MANEKRLIDVFMHMGDHIQSLDEYGFCFDSTLAKAIEDVVAMLKNPDANDVVPVVRCKDCKHYVWDEFDGAYVCVQLSKYVKKDFYCSYGERRAE